MRHGSKNKKFGRVRKVRSGLMRGLAVSFILHKRIETGEIKAKALRPFIERLITLEKKGTIAGRRLANSRLGNVAKAEEVLNKIATSDSIAKRSGGYTRITKLQRRSSDGAKRAVIEFV